jgi:hypothetical protein
MLSSLNFYVGVFDLFVAIIFAIAVPLTVLSCIFWLFLLAVGVSNLYIAFMNEK